MLVVWENDAVAQQTIYCNLLHKNDNIAFTGCQQLFGWGGARPAAHVIVHIAPDFDAPLPDCESYTP
jgi:hypothetical protein